MSQLLTSKWWEGPSWLKEPAETWPDHAHVFNEEEINHAKTTPKVDTRGKTILTLLATDLAENNTFF